MNQTGCRQVTMIAEDHEFSSVDDIITEATKYGHTILYMNYKGLVEIPKNLLKPPICNIVERLYLKRNLLQTLPTDIGRLSGLVELYLHSNSIVDLPNEISNLGKLESLDVCCNKLQSIPPTIGDLHTLKKLHLSNNELTKLPPEIGNLKELINLEAVNNRITSIPSEICHCHSLKSLTLDRNQLRELPRQLVNMTYLEEISAVGNKLTHVPSDLGMMPSLKSVYLDSNPLLYCVPFSLWNKGIGANSCHSADVQQIAEDSRLLIEMDGYITPVPPEIKQVYTLQDANQADVPSLLDCCLKVVYRYKNLKDSQKGKLYIEQTDLPRYLSDLLHTPTAHCLAPNACEKPIFTVAYARIFKLGWAQPWQDKEPNSIPFLGLCCSKQCLKLFTRFPVPV
ncbi:leucine-rich repeat-containing protein 28-like isoform X2 [Glandiceps talaboti]